MIPQFPKFKHLELSDEKEVEEFSYKFPSYSDFNFVSMWSWDISGGMCLSILNDNLVVCFSDYLTSKPFYSFLGESMINETAEELLAFSKNKGMEPKLKLIPEDVAKKLDTSKFNIESDRDQFDYVYSVPHLADMNHWPKHTSGKNIRTYIKSCPHYIVKDINVREADKDEYVVMFEKWAKEKAIEDYSELNEFKAFERVFETKHKNVNIVSIYVDDILVGFTVYQTLPSDYAISHFAKANIKHHCGTGDVLNWEEAKILDKKGVKYFNWEQDLGIPGLRESKEKYKPEFLLKKVSVSRFDK